MKHHGRYELQSPEELLKNIQVGEDIEEVRNFFDVEVQRLKKHHHNSKKHHLKQRKKGK